MRIRGPSQESLHAVGVELLKNCSILRWLDEYVHVVRSRTSVPQEKLPASRRKARNLVLPPRTRTFLTATLLDSLVMAGWRPSSYLQGTEQPRMCISPHAACMQQVHTQVCTSRLVCKRRLPLRIAYFFFLRQCFFLPPVALRLCRESRLMPATKCSAGKAQQDHIAVCSRHIATVVLHRRAIVAMPASVECECCYLLHACRCAAP